MAQRSLKQSHNPSLSLTLLIAILLMTQTLSAREIDKAAFTRQDDAINAAIGRSEIPGAVLLAGTDHDIVYLKAYGNRAVEPDKLPMKTDTIFDLASLSKSVGCASSIMVLVDQGKIDVHEPVAKYIPEFAANGKEKITVEQLLLHWSGMIPDNSMDDYKVAPTRREKHLRHQTRVRARREIRLLGSEFRSARRNGASGQWPAARSVRTSTFCAARHDRHDVQPTGQFEGSLRFWRSVMATGWTARFTIPAPSRWRRRRPRGRLQHGHRCRQVLSDAAQRWRPEWPSDHAGKNRQRMDDLPATSRWHGPRGYGLDFDTGYSPSVRGERFEKGTTFGHTGYTGTSFWIDPVNKCFVVLLTNRVHPSDEKGKVTRVRREVATAVAEAFLGPHGEPASAGGAGPTRPPPPKSSTESTSSNATISKI